MDTLIGVIVGGVIGYVAAITTLVVEHRRWRKEFKLQYLITERRRREEQCNRIKNLLVKGLDEDSCSIELAIDMWLRLPQKTSQLIEELWKKIDHSQPEGKRELYQKAALVLGNYLAEIDEQIEKMAR